LPFNIKRSAVIKPPTIPELRTSRLGPARTSRVRCAGSAYSLRRSGCHALLDPPPTRDIAETIVRRSLHLL